MKCDELFVYCKTTCDPQGLYYSKSEVDEAVAELKVRNVMFHDEAKYYKAENEQLKAKLENVQASAYADSVDARMRERRLRSALWLLKSRYFWILMAYASDLARIANPSIIQKTNMLQNPTPRCMEEYQHEAELYDNARIKCLKKAEEYR